jgi:hypothetical protein
MNRVVHCKKDKFDVYIGRPNKWGNPYELTEYSREESISKFKEYITNGNGKHLLKDLHELKNKTLGCWCYPKNCHGNILIELVNELETK